MSRIGRQPIPLSSAVDVSISGNEVTVKGPKGSLTREFAPEVTILQDGDLLKVEISSEENRVRALHGLTRSLLANMVTGVTEGFAKTLELVGVGYRVDQKGSGVTLSVMLSHTVDIKPRDGITLEVENSLLHVRGIDKQVVGQTASEIRSIRPPNPYTGKGIRYQAEFVRIKPGKSARKAEI